MQRKSVIPLPLQQCHASPQNLMKQMTFQKTMNHFIYYLPTKPIDFLDNQTSIQTIPITLNDFINTL